MNQSGADALCGLRKRQHAKCVHPERFNDAILSTVDVVERRAIDDDVGPDLLDTLLNRTTVGEVERLPIERMDVAVG